MAAFPATPILDTGAGPVQNPLPEGNPWISGVQSGFAGFGLSRNGIGGLYSPIDDVESRWPTVFPANQEMYVQVTTTDPLGSRFALFTRISYVGGLNCYQLYHQPGGGANAFYQVYRYKLGAFAGALGPGALFQPKLANGDWLGMRNIGNTISVMRKRGAGDWQQVMEFTDTSVTAPGGIGLGMYDQPGHTWVFANFGGGTIQDAQSDVIIGGRGATR